MHNTSGRARERDQQRSNNKRNKRIRAIRSVALSHHEHCQGRPAGEGSAALALARPVVVLLPHVARPLVLLGHVLDERAPQLLVHLAGLGPVRAVLLGVVLERAHGEVVDVDPDGAAPVGRVVLGVARAVQASRGRERAQAVGREEAGGVLDRLQDVAQFRRVGGHDLQQEGEQTCGKKRGAVLNFIGKPEKWALSRFWNRLRSLSVLWTGTKTGRRDFLG